MSNVFFCSAETFVLLVEKFALIINKWILKSKNIVFEISLKLSYETTSCFIFYINKYIYAMYQIGFSVTYRKQFITLSKNKL